MSENATRGECYINRPDLIVVWPKSVDYPLFRYNLKRFRNYFDQVLIAISDNGTLEDYTNFFTNNITGAHFKSILRAGGDQDWRNIAVNSMLEKSTSDRVLFIEQDFLIRDERFFEVLLNVNEYDFIYYDEGGRQHPACALVPRYLIDKTSRDFSARPPAYDHFGLFFRELNQLGHGADLETIGLHDRVDHLHLAGTCQNYHAKPFHKPNQFLSYNRLCLDLPVVFNEFKEKMIAIDKDPSNPFFLDEPVRSMFPRKEGV